MNSIFNLRILKQFMLLGLLILLLPDIAFAQANIFEPVAGDKSMVILKALFGQLGVFGPSSADAFSGVITVLNGAALTIGGMLVAYTIFTSTISTAHDGEMLGKKFSSVWVPMRTAFGTALVMPVINGSYCVMQSIVGWLIVQGIGLADNVWSTYTSGANVTVASSIGLGRPAASGLGYTAFQSFVCVEAMKKVAQDPTLAVLIGNSSFGTTVENSPLKTVYKFGDKTSSNGFKTDSCGSVTVANFQVPTLGPTTGGPIAPIVNAKDSIERTKDIILAHQTQVLTLLSTLQAQAETLVATQATINPAAIDTAIEVYESGVQQSAGKIIAQMDAFKEISANASKDGFILAGAYYMKLSSFTDLIHRSMADVPSAVGPSGDINPTYFDEYLKFLGPTYKTLDATKTATSTYAIGNTTGGSNDSWIGTAKSFLSSGLDLNILMKKLVVDSTNFVIQDGENPVLAMKRLGDHIINIAVLSLLGKGLVALGVLGNMPGVGMALQTMMMIFVPPLLITGVFLAYVLPMMPFMTWMGAIIAWLILCVEAIIAAPIWAVMHLHPHGDDMTGKGGNGYNLVLSLLIRPMLMVFGFIASISILNIFGSFYNAVFADVFAMSQQDSGVFIWLVSIIMSGLLYSLGMWMIIKKTFAIIHEVPDHMLEWFGQSSNTLGRSAQEVGATGTAIAGAQILSKVSGDGYGAISKSIDNREKTFEMDNKTAMSLDKEFGSGTSDMFNKMNGTQDGNTGLSNHNTSQQAAQMNEAMNMLGGKNSFGGAAFMERMKDSVNSNPDMTFNEHVAGSMSKCLDDKYGPSTLDTAMKVGNGPESSAMTDSGNLLNPEVKRAVSMYGAIANKMANNGMSPDEIKESIGGFNQKVQNAFNENSNPTNPNANPEKSYKNFFSDELKTLRDPK